jgi:hypothetical protein
MIQVKAFDSEGTPVAADIDKWPDTCPACHYGINALVQNLAYVNGNSRLEIVFLCPRLRCRSLFIGRYFQRVHTRTHFFEESVPYKPIGFEWAESILSISPSFCAIADEAQNAEHQGWKRIAGPGYRKALEFLIKDYLCKKRPADIEKIKSTQLGGCIDKYVDNENVKQMAKRAAWLGNDETHYTRKWEDKDLEDLKKVMELTVHWIVMEELTHSVLTAMPTGKP